MQMELYGPPMSEGVLRVDVQQGDVVVERPFYVGVTHSAIEDTLEMPLVVAHVTERHWKKS